MACCTCTVLFLFVFCLLFVDNLFFYSGGQSVSCKVSLAALRLYGYFCDIVVIMLLSENKYDDDDDMSKTTNDVLTRSGTGCFIAVLLGNSGRQRVKLC